MTKETGVMTFVSFNKLDLIIFCLYLMYILRFLLLNIYSSTFTKKNHKNEKNILLNKQQMIC